MALKALMIRKKIDDCKKLLSALNEVDFEKREQELEQSIEEATTDEEKAAVEEAVEAFESEKAKNEEEVKRLEAEISDLEKELAETEADQNKRSAEKSENTEIEKRKADKDMDMRIFDKPETRARLEKLTERDDVKAYCSEIRAAIKEKRELKNVGVTIPKVLLGLLRENIAHYSKLYSRVSVSRISGDGRVIIAGTIPEAVWTEMCANLNELDLGFNDLELSGYKVGGFFAVCNAVLEDSDVDLISEIMTALGQSIGLALDKAILYGAGTRMPLGVMTRLAQTVKPSDAAPSEREWEDLHTTNIKSVASSVTGSKLFAQIVLNTGAAKSDYSNGTLIWCMNNATKTRLLSEAIHTNAAGAFVAGFGNTMPIIGGEIIELPFIPENVMVGGYFDLYKLLERSGEKFAQSEHFRFTSDQTVFKGTARYDGKPAIAEGFIAIGINGATPSGTMTFAEDKANETAED